LLTFQLSPITLSVFSS